MAVHLERSVSALEAKKKFIKTQEQLARDASRLVTVT